MEIRTLGIDLAKNLFRIHGVDAKGRTTLERQLRRRKLLSFVAQLQPCLVGMEACGGAHYWAGEIAKLGHKVRLMSPRFGTLCHYDAALSQQPAHLVHQRRALANQ